MTFSQICFFLIISSLGTILIAQEDCETTALPSFQTPKETYLKNNQTLTPLGVHLVIDYYTYEDFHRDEDSIMNWVTQMFAKTQEIYETRGISLTISHVDIHTEMDTFYGSWSLRTNLELLGYSLQDDIIGDLSQLVTTKNLGGGRAYITNLCASYDPVSHGGMYSVISGLSKEIVIENDFNWNIYLMAHELGHLMGSSHTHSCSWGPNHDQPLDNCFYDSGECGDMITDDIFGTIMSYCYRYDELAFANGIANHPAQRMITNIVNAESCLYYYSPCTAGSSCDDQNDCTTQDTYTPDCECIGTLIDHNENDICDLDEDCENSLYISALHDTLKNISLAKNHIISDACASSQSETIFSAGQTIEMMGGFEIPAGASFEAHMTGCDRE